MCVNRRMFAMWGGAALKVRFLIKWFNIENTTKKTSLEIELWSLSCNLANLLKHIQNQRNYNSRYLS